MYEVGHNNMKKILVRSDNRGISLLEIIVTIAIIATLTGLLVPQFMHYVSQKREVACEENREAIVGICERLVYGRAVPLSTFSGVTLNDATIQSLPSTISDVDKEALKRHAECPDHGNMTLRVTGSGVLVCECDVNTSEISVDLTTWTGSGIAVADPIFDTPSGIAYVPPEYDENEEFYSTESGDPPEPIDPTYRPDTYWPFNDPGVWGDDETEKFIGAPSGLFPVRTSGGNTVFCCVIDRTGTGSLKVERDKASSPLNYPVKDGPNSNREVEVVVTNGVSYNQDTIIEAAKKNRSIWNDVGGDSANKEIDVNDEFFVSSGTIYTTGDGTRYVCYCEGRVLTKLPPEGGDCWFRIGTTDHIR